MKRQMLFTLTISIFFVAGIVMNCKKEAIKTAPTVTLSAVTNITGTTASSGGVVTATGGAALSAAGVCWSTSQNPTISDHKTTDGTGTGSFISQISGLVQGTTYYLKAYATNSVGTGYSSQVSFKTTDPPLAAIDVSQNTQWDYWAVAKDGSNYFVKFDSNFKPVSAYFKPGLTQSGYIIYFDLIGLPSKMVIAEAVFLFANYRDQLVDVARISSAGDISLHRDISVTIDLNMFPLKSIKVSRALGLGLQMSGQSVGIASCAVGQIPGNPLAVAGCSATITGLVGANPNITPTGITSEVGGTMAGSAGCSSPSGVTGCVTTLAETGSTLATSALTLLGTPQVTSALLQLQLPTVTTSDISAITATSAKSGGTIPSIGAGPLTANGVCWSTGPAPTIPGSHSTDIIITGAGSFTSSITGLTPNTTYYVRAYATNSSGTTYGNEVSVTTTKLTVTDIDGNVYQTVTIGIQTWMAENLKTTKYRNGDPIPIVTDNSTWVASTTGAYSWYNNDEATYKATYGALYNWYALNDSRYVAPLGWHVPSDVEWTTLITLLGGENVTSGKLKETGNAHWVTPNNGATNETGFTALPGGNRNLAGVFISVGLNGRWWSSMPNSTNRAWCYSLYNDDAIIYINPDFRQKGYSVRCVKDYVVSSPTVLTSPITNMTQTSAISGGTIIYDGGANIIERGVCWSTSQTPSTADSKTSDGTGIGSFTSSITGMTSGTYYARAYATNSAGTAYGDVLTINLIIFNPNLSYGTVTDIDGNSYKTIKIGTQTWMAENLKTTKYRNGEPITYYSINTTGAAFFWVNNDEATYKYPYGALYNWYASNDTRNIAPAGWHVPTFAEFTTLTNFLGGDSIAGGKLKETGISHWASPNTGATNETGFTALPAGYLNSSFSQGGLRSSGDFWTSQPIGTFANGRFVNYDNGYVGYCGGSDVLYFSIRCIKD